MQAKLKGAIRASLAGFVFAVALVATQMATLAGTLLASPRLSLPPPPPSPCASPWRYGPKPPQASR